jgi:23S rRNA (cytidine1920-2'-O)/16S rRNA (cytidine1409-2'-O)-methyltransferase
LTKVLPVTHTLLTASGEVVALIKPQFEAGRENVGKKGVVRDPKVHEDVIRKVTAFARELGFVTMALTFSPVKGPEGNIEYLIRLSKDASQTDTVTEERIVTVVAEAHGALDK